MLSVRTLFALLALIMGEVPCQLPHDGEKLAAAAQPPGMGIPAAVTACVAQHASPPKPQTSPSTAGPSPIRYPADSWRVPLPSRKGSHQFYLAAAGPGPESVDWLQPALGAPRVLLCQQT